jgi:hypothetical protein
MIECSRLCASGRVSRALFAVEESFVGAGSSGRLLGCKGVVSCARCLLTGSSAPPRVSMLPTLRKWVHSAWRIVPGVLLPTASSRFVLRPVMPRKLGGLQAPSSSVRALGLDSRRRTSVAACLLRAETTDKTSVSSQEMTASASSMFLDQRSMYCLDTLEARWL